MNPNPWTEAGAAHWRVVDAAQLTADTALETDVAIVGRGAGGGMPAEILSRAGLKVVLIEEGPLQTSADFRMREADAYPQLYQESAARKTRDKAINIMQGRGVGGSTTVNWTSSFRTPPSTLAYWQERLGLADLGVQELAPWFARVEERLGIAPWNFAPNANNALLQTGGAALGLKVQAIRRNVRGCWNLGYCGMGCPTDAKQSMLVTTIPAALAAGATLYSRLRAERLEWRNGSATALACRAMSADGLRATGARVDVRARHFVLAGGAINTPALLLRSAAPDPHHLVGRRSFLHPTLISAAQFADPVDGHAGAPQSLYSDHYLEQQPVDGPIGFKLEAPPLHPVLFATTMQGFGNAHAQMMRNFTHTHVLLALLRDGFHADSDGGRVELRDDGTPVLDYPLSDFVWDGVRRAWLAMAEIQFAAGALALMPVHEQATLYRSWREAQAAIERLPLKPLAARVVSAHVMGGCAMGAAATRGVVDSRGRHF
ncbi:MAG: GMC family oxidoreductase, partial [Rhodocyclales bacterium]|nr:GMC family oxidoreductase [Rhodocyclales bacterium]